MAIGNLFRSQLSIMQEMVDKENAIRRNIAPPMSGVDFARTTLSLPARTLISGGQQSERLWLEHNRITLALRKGHSVVCIICPEDEVVAYDDPLDGGPLRLTGQSSWTGPVCFEDGTQWGFDPLICEDTSDLTASLAQLSASISGDNFAKSDFWSFVMDLLQAIHGTATLDKLLKLNFLQIQQTIVKLAGERKLTPQQHREFLQRYDSSLSIQAAAANDLCSMLRPLTKCLRDKNVGMQELIHRRGVLLVDTVPAGNRACINLLLLLLSKAAVYGKFALVADGIGCDKNDTIRTQFISASDASLPMILGGDLPALMGEQFDGLIGGNSIKFVLNHDSGASAEKWSRFFGVYAKQILEYSTGENKSNTAIVEKSKGRNYSVRTDENAFKITVDHVQKLKPGQALARVSGDQRIFRLVFPKVTLAEMKEHLCL